MAIKLDTFKKAAQHTVNDFSNHYSPGAFSKSDLTAVKSLYGGLSDTDKESAINWLGTTGDHDWLQLMNYLQGGTVYSYGGTYCP